MSKEDKWYKILNELLIKDEVTLNYLSKITSSSQATLKKNIDFLNEEMKGISEIVEGVIGYKLEISNVIKFEEIMNGKLREKLDFNSSKKRIAFMIIEFLENKEYITIDEFTERLKVSRTTVNNDLKELKVILSRYSLKLQGKSNCGLKLVGDELGIRLLLLYHAFDYFSYKFPLEKNVYRLLIALQEEFNLDKENMRIFKKSVSIVIYRILHGYKMDERISIYTNYERNTKNINELTETINNTYQCQLTRYDIDFICFPINTRNTAHVSPQTMKMYEESVYIVYKKIIEEIRYKLVIDLDEDEFFQNVKYHLMFMMNRVIFHVDRVNIVSIVTQLTNEMHLHSSFLGLCEEREKVSSTIFEQGIGIPHAINKDSNKIVLCGGNSEKKSENQEVQALFLLAVPETLDEEVSNIIIKLYDIIFLIAKNQQLFKRMIEIQDKEEFISYMREVTQLL